ncbi:MAG: hypothetical protein LBF97_04975 [Elusimicrobiota bacterium]|jgi:KDO2-lipid IV(A) lauroyltransferase|nr:hypothetical protein [Elusimicrobiota bacterium]
MNNILKNFNFCIDNTIKEKIKTFSKKIRLKIESYILICLSFIFSKLNIKLSYILARILGILIYFFIPIRKKVAYYNLKRVFRKKSNREIYAIIMKMYINFSYFFLESIIMKKLRIDKIYGLKDNVKVYGLEILQEAVNKEKGVILYTGHIGNWHVMGQKLVELGFPINNVIKRQRNPFIFEKEMNTMLNAGMKISILQKTPKNIFQALKEKDVVEFLADQDAGKDGIFVDFFGLKASTAVGPALFSLKLGSPLIFAVDIREKFYKHKIFIEKIDYTSIDDKEKDIYNLTKLLTQKIEKYIISNPSQYFWLHRRWFTRPK